MCVNYVHYAYDMVHIICDHAAVSQNIRAAIWFVHTLIWLFVSCSYTFDIYGKYVIKEYFLRNA